MTTSFFPQTCNYPRPGNVLVSEGQRSRPSESAPPRSITPPQPKAGAAVLPRPAAPAPGPAAPAGRTRRCRRCRETHPEDSFLLWDHPDFQGAASHDSNAARFWCETCLQGSALARKPAVKRAFAERDRAREHARAVHQLAANLADRADGDPVFAAAVRMAATAIARNPSPRKK